jgi:hypothetical protein
MTLPQDIIETVARAHAFARRSRLDQARDADHYWQHTGEETQALEIAATTAALETLRPLIEERDRLREALERIIARAPDKNPDGPYDQWGGYCSDNIGDVVSETRQEEAWECAEIARTALDTPNGEQ